MSKAPTDLYRTLGVPRCATVEQIKAAYRRQAQRFHPDKNPDPEVEEHFKRCSEAFSVLSDPRRRTAYDEQRLLHSASSDMPRLIGDLLADLWGSRDSRKRDGEHLRLALELTLADLAGRSTHVLRYSVDAPCGACEMTGAPRDARRPCPTCEGKGELRAPGLLPFYRPCPRCGGQRFAALRSCEQCDGVGSVLSERSASLDLPGSIADGALRIVSGAGAPGAFGGRDGDLQVVIRVVAHELFERQGADLLLELPVNAAQAAAGLTAEVLTLDGPVRMKIPPGTQPGTLLRLRGKGLRTGVAAERGDQLVRVFVETPQELEPGLQQELHALYQRMPAALFPRTRAYEQALSRCRAPTLADGQAA